MDSGYGTVATHSNPLRQSNDNLLKVVVRKSYPKNLKLKVKPKKINSITDLAEY